MSYVIVENLVDAAVIPDKGIVSHTLYSDSHVKVVLFGFDVGQELSEHTASMPATIHILKGQAQITLGSDSIRAIAGTWVHMPSWLPHSIQAETPVLMLLTLVKGGKVSRPTDDPCIAVPALTSF